MRELTAAQWRCIEGDRRFLKCIDIVEDKLRTIARDRIREASE